MMARLLFIFATLLMAGCGGGAVNILPEPFTRERADGKIPVKTELIRQQVQRELGGMPEGEAEVARWQQIEADYNACRLSSRGKKSEVEKKFANCMSQRGYVYMYRIDAEQLHNDIAFDMEKEHNERIAAERKAEEEKIAAAQKAEEERITAEKKRQEEQERIRRQTELDHALVDVVYATEDDNVAEVKRLIDGGANVNITTGEGFTLLHTAAGKGQTKIALTLVNAGVYIDEKTNRGNTPLHSAALYGRTETALSLIDAGANVNAKDNYGDTALHFAALYGRTKTASALVNAGADVDARQNDGWTPLHRAAGKGHIQTALALVNAGASLWALTNTGDTPLDIAIVFHGKDSTIALFLHKAMKQSSDKNRQKAEDLLHKLK